MTILSHHFDKGGEKIILTIDIFPRPTSRPSKLCKYHTIRIFPTFRWVAPLRRPPPPRTNFGIFIIERTYTLSLKFIAIISRMKVCCAKVKLEMQSVCFFSATYIFELPCFKKGGEKIILTSVRRYKL